MTDGLTFCEGTTDSGTPYLRCDARGMRSIYAYPSGDFWVARLHDGRRVYETRHGCIGGMRACMLRSARAVLPLNGLLLDALSDIASGHNDPRARAMEAMAQVFPDERGET